MAGKRTRNASCCGGPSARETAPDELERWAGLFKAVGDPVRLRLLSMIAEGEGVCVCTLMGAFVLSGPTVSHHLKVLRTAGLIQGDRRGTWVYYRVAPAATDLVAGLLELVGTAPTALDTPIGDRP